MTPAMMQLVCGACILAMASAVDAEQARRDGEKIAQRGSV